MNLGLSRVAENLTKDTRAVAIFANSLPRWVRRVA
jgi:hypothetical protein